MVAIIAFKNERLARQIEAELELLGFTVYRVPSRLLEEDVPLNLDVLARELGASAVIALTIKSGALQIWVMDRVTNKFSLRKLTVPDLRDHDHIETVALQAVELLRASLTEFALGARPPRSDKGPHEPFPRVRPGNITLNVIETTLDRRRRLPSRRPSYVAYTTAAFEYSAGTQGLVPRLEAGFAFRVAPFLDIALHNVLPLYSERTNALGSGVDVLRGSTTAGVIWYLIEDHGWNIPISGRVGMSWTSYRGDAAPGLTENTGSFVRPVLELRGGIQKRLGDRLALRLGVTLGTTLLAHEVSISGQEVVRWGTFIGRLDLGVEFGF